VGPAADLTALGIEVVADLPVGRRLQDHPFFYNAYALAPGYLEMTPAIGSMLWTASSEAVGDELDLHITVSHLLDGSYSPTGAPSCWLMTGRGRSIDLDERRGDVHRMAFVPGRIVIGMTGYRSTASSTGAGTVRI
jgi:hypothetical protein